MTPRSFLVAGGLATALVVSLAPSLVQAKEPDGLSVDYEIGVVSDYRYRGYSLSDEKPALQLGATVSAPSGWYAGAWGSTIDEYGVGADGDGAKVEIDLLAGKTFSVGAFDFDLGVQGYLYPDGSDVGYMEIPLSASRTAGAWTWTLGAVYAPEQSALGSQDNRYLFGGLAWQAPEQPWSVTAQLGYEDGAFAPDGKWDWEVGANRAFGPVTAGLSYIDTDEPGVDSALVASLKATF